ncbi:Pls/PosA family non-ribosomal peptide synthetase [Limnoglobus roseus]|uniref:Peptide synthetase n=1 Tax=Limnoglobus roseus TaxID=2598579 RepID=A0A5C1AD97_9BACT|nr:Pls/PosA family non-ribosomal peptide synthetase [Limnoglobus roseus]QEL15028.1 peptide synthetase [Limnoglobus roseus]
MASHLSPGGVTVLHDWLHRSADTYPDRPAVVCGDRTLSYADLERHANRLARHLRALGVGPGQFVGLLLERSAEVSIGLLAILKAGAAYVPLDPDYPAERIADILSDCAAAVLVTSPALREKAHTFQSKMCDLVADRALIDAQSPERLSAAEVSVGPGDLAYVIYTSGSTGRPKGVMIEHRSVCHLVRVEAELYGLRPDDRVFQGFSIAFDASVEEVWAAFANGAALVVGTRELMQSGPDLGRHLTDLGVTVFSTVPTLLAMLDGNLPTVRTLILGGEACPAELVTRWATPGRTMFNTYGPTEATVIATAAVCQPGRPVTIGKPLDGYTVLLLDEVGQPVPSGGTGEIYIGGVGVARGYVGRDDLTRERFVPNPFLRDDRLYRTGDLARWTADGELEFLGRCDEQVKIRGYRVELSEVEAGLLAVPGVRAAVAAVLSDGGGVPSLIGYVISANGPIADDVLRSHLRARLPVYMVPSRFVAVAEFPTLPSGKVDRKRLPAPQWQVEDLAPSDGTPPRTEFEARVAVVWAKVFGRPAVSVTDDFFFDLGGHSLLAARAISDLRAEPEFRHAAVADVYQHPTVAQLARHLEATRPAAVVPRAKPRVHGRSIPPLRHFLCGLGQFFALYVVLGFFSLQWMGPYLVYADCIDRGWALPTAVAAALVSLAAVYPLMLLIGVVAKWVLLGRVKPGTHPLWGWYYFRWWFAGSILSATPTGYLTGTPLLGLYYRLLGVRVGRNVYLGTDNAGAFELLSIGDDTCVGSDVGLRGHTVEGGFLHLGTITVGRGCYIGSRSVLMPGSAVSDNVKLDDLSLVRTGQTLPAGERWAGSPARRVGIAEPSNAVRPGLARRIALGVVYGVGSFLLRVAAIVCFLPGIIWLNSLSHQWDGYLYLAVAPVVALSFVILFALQVVGVKWLLLGEVRAGTYPRYGLFAVRKWFVDRLMELSLDATGTLYGTIFLNPWYRLLGVKLGRRVEVSTACSIPHDLLTLDDESFLADAVSIGGARVEGNTLTLAPVRIGKKAFAGNGAHIPPGGQLGDDGLLGCQSILPAAAIKPGTAWVGSPAFHLPQRQESAAFPDAAITNPPLKLWLLRGAIEFVRVVLPATALVVLSSLLISWAVTLRYRYSVWHVLALFPLLYALAGLGAALFVVAVKWVVAGRYRPTERPLWSGFVWRTEFISGVREYLADLFLVGLLTGTPFVCWYFRLMGAKIGRRVFMDTTDLCEFDLTRVGDEAELNEDCTLQTHLFEDRVMKVSNIEIGPGATVGGWTLILYDTVVEAGTVVEDLSLVMKGEVLPADTRWAGIPAARAENFQAEDE